MHPSDNVATLLDDAPPGAVELLGAPSAAPIEISEPIKLGHKLALEELVAGAPIVKFGETIGRATERIPRGAWVHLHNVTSEFDARSQTLDVQTGAATDTQYE